MISERDNTAEAISQAIQSQLAAMLTNMIHETLADFSDDIAIPAGRWDASEKLSSFLDVLFADRPLSVYEGKQITKEFPRPNVESVFTPVLDDYLGSLVTGAKGVDKEAKKHQDQLLDIVGPLSMAFEHITPW